MSEPHPLSHCFCLYGCGLSSANSILDCPPWLHLFVSLGWLSVGCCTGKGIHTACPCTSPLDVHVDCNRIRFLSSPSHGILQPGRMDGTFPSWDGPASHPPTRTRGMLGVVDTPCTPIPSQIYPPRDPPFQRLPFVSLLNPMGFPSATRIEGEPSSIGGPRGV